MPVKKRKAKAKPPTKLKGAVVKPGSPGSARPPGAPVQRAGEKDSGFIKRLMAWADKRQQQGRRKRTATKASGAAKRSASAATRGAKAGARAGAARKRTAAKKRKRS